mmetsp:Transcript_44733/g.124381  ORF Transcript_44733/g.124381 Transcript_44733/m.124381 type:complete len:86 (-) Transcript_44733:552-809(-)
MLTFSTSTIHCGLGLGSGSAGLAVGFVGLGGLWMGLKGLLGLLVGFAGLVVVVGFPPSAELHWGQATQYCLYMPLQSRGKVLQKV